jgi:Transposase, Mutator family
MNRREQFDSANIVSWKCILQVCDGSVAGVVDAPGPPNARGAVRRCGRQGHGEPGVAEGEGRLGGLERPLARRGADRAADPGRHRGVGPARPQGPSISLLVVIGVREDGQKVLLALKNMGGESTETWRAVLDDLVDRGLYRPAFLIVDGAPELEKAIAAIWDGVPVQRCTVHKHRNLLAHAPDRLHDEITADYTDMIYAATPEEIASRRNAFIRKWRPRHRAADSLEEAGDFHSPATDPVAQRKDHERDRASARGVQATDQNPDRATVGRYCCDVVLGAARLRADQHAESRRLADARHNPIDRKIDLAA